MFSDADLASARKKPAVVSAAASKQEKKSSANKKRPLAAPSSAARHGTFFQDKIANATRGRNKKLTKKPEEGETEKGLEISPEAITPPDPAAQEVSHPGAVRIPGPGAHQDPNQSVEVLDAQGERPVLSEEASEHLINAVLVDDDRWDEVEVTIASAVRDKPWRRRLGILALILLSVGITVAVVVPLTSGTASGSASGTGTPTATPAPRSLGLITVVLQLDAKPLETGWKLDCGGLNLANFTAGVYQGRANRLVTQIFPVVIGDVCKFTITDSGGDGLDGGFFRVYSGQEFSADVTPLVEGPSTFTDKAQVTFEIIPLPTIAPTPSPTMRPTSSPTAAPTATPGSPAAAPTTAAPTPVREESPPAIEHDITVVIQLDEFPAETGWGLECNGDSVASIPPLTYGDPFQLIKESLTVFVFYTTECRFTITDSFGDGICCNFEPGGFYQVFLGTDTTDFSKLVGEGGQFGSQQEVVFYL